MDMAYLQRNALQLLVGHKIEVSAQILPHWYANPGTSLHSQANGNVIDMRAYMARMAARGQIAREQT